MTFRPTKLSQFQPLTPLSSKDCVPTTAAQLVNRATVDAKRPDHDDIRKASGVTATRGLTYLEAAKGAAKYGVSLLARLGLSRNQARDLLASGCAAGFSIDCSVTVNTSRRTNSFTGGHTVYVQSWSRWPGGDRCSCELATTTAHGEFSVEDPGTTIAGYLQWSESLLFRAAEARTGGHGINVLAAPDTEARSWKAVTASAIRSQPSYSTGTTLATMKIGQVFPGGRTDNGGSWKRADGTYGQGWIHVQMPSGKWGWVKGEALVMA